MHITMPRGDLRPVPFQVVDDDDNIVDVEFDEIYMTVKRSSRFKDYYFQKRLSNGTIMHVDDIYQFNIEPEDTDNMNFGEYDFDIELVKEGEIKQTTKGKLILTEEVTHAGNEG